MPYFSGTVGTAPTTTSIPCTTIPTQMPTAVAPNRFILQFTSGVNKGVCRYVNSASLSAIAVNTLTTAPAAGDTFEVVQSDIYYMYIAGFKDLVQVDTVTTTTFNLDMSVANVFDITLSPATGNNVAFTYINIPVSNEPISSTLILRQDATGSRTMTMTNAHYTEGTVPVLSTGANQVDVLSFFTTDGGSYWFGSLSMANVY